MDPLAIVSSRAARTDRAAQSRASAFNMSYHGGPVLANVEVVTVFWGSSWPTDPLASMLDKFFDFVVQSSYMDQLAEYSAGGITIGRGKHVLSVQITSDPPNPVDDTQIQAFLQGFIANGTLPPVNANTLYFVFIPSGVQVTLQGSASCQQFCGYHNSDGNGMFYAVIPYEDCPGCQFASALLDDFTVVCSHELGEAVTDPNLDAWFDDASGEEIGDPCEGSDKTIGLVTAVGQIGQILAPPEFSVAVSPSQVAIDGTVPVDLTITLTPVGGTPPPPPPPPPPPVNQSYQVQTLWSNKAGGCV